MLALARTEVAATMDCDAVLEIVGSTSQGLQAKSRKTDDDGSPCARGCCAHVLANRYGLDARDTRASLGFASDGSACSGTTRTDFDVDSIPSRSGGQDAVTYV
jgi:hypothetical protein